MSKFRIAIIREDDEPVLLHPGSQGERDLVDAITQQIVSKGVGFFRTEARVRRLIAAGINDVLMQLKSEVQPT